MCVHREEVGAKKSLLLSNRSVAGTKKQAYKFLLHRSNQQSENKACKGFLVKVLTLDLEFKRCFS
jgi:hypothetical protein